MPIFAAEEVDLEALSLLENEDYESLGISTRDASAIISASKAQSARFTGVVEVLTKTHGFVKPDDGTSSIFIHNTDLREGHNFRNLKRGARVEYSLGECAPQRFEIARLSRASHALCRRYKGKSKAVDVTILRNEAKAAKKAVRREPTPVATARREPTPAAPTSPVPAARARRESTPASPARATADECPCCFERCRDSALVPCGHVLCAVCVSTYASAGTCPVCRQDIANVVRIFL
jgi:cold shock CspA family protein